MCLQGGNLPEENICHLANTRGVLLAESHSLCTSWQIQRHSVEKIQRVRRFFGRGFRE